MLLHFDYSRYNDQTVPFEQSEELYDKLIENGCDADLIALEGADHADLQFFRMNCGIG